MEKYRKKANYYTDDVVNYSLKSRISKATTKIIYQVARETERKQMVRRHPISTAQCARRWRNPD